MQRLAFKEYLRVPREAERLPLFAAEAGQPPCTVEIGFGNGEFLAHYGASCPEERLVGIEVSLTCVAKAAKRLARAEVRNVSLLHGDARFLLRECFGDGSVRRLFMHFPCPWPKSRHAPRRVTGGGFPDTLAAVLQQKGVFELVTDEAWYADETADLLDRHDALRCALYEKDPQRGITTKYERKWRDQGKSLFRVLVERTHPWSVRRLAKGGMPLQIQFPFQGDVAALEGINQIERGEAGCLRVLLESFAGSGGIRLVQVLTVDEGFEQRFYVRVVPRVGEVLVKIDSASMPFRTPAVKAALHDIAGLLQEGVSS
ncbi:MAG: tRNA (guanosine(46)-N7)-methyltransferase TrmB [Synergistales bacterium]|nr:tRNA (guanosine(46)-N7)-methyltransferase TrmB [Synergistales bacterium]